MDGIKVNLCIKTSIVSCLVCSASSQAKGTKSTSFLMNEVDLVALACEDGSFCMLINKIVFCKVLIGIEAGISRGTLNFKYCIMLN